MLSYDEYLAHMYKLTAPTSLPDNMAVMYAISLGRPIAQARMDEDVLYLRFEGGGTLRIWDNGQSCCENRYMTTDDELDTFVGAKLVDIDIARGPDVEEEPDEDGYTSGDPHEQMFVKLETTMGTITLVTHNEHNGYYGGFDVESDWGV